MKNLKMICFDMDGTIADLYGVENWLTDLENENVRPYVEAEPLCDMEKLGEVLTLFINLGIEIRVISWLSQKATPEYKRDIRTAKRDWLDDQNFPYNKAHLIRYGATKANCVRMELAEDETAILFDDNAKIRNGWHLGEAYGVDNIIGTLYAILGEIVGEE